MVSFLEKLIEVDCSENRRPLSQVGESHWILLANIFQRMEFRLAGSWRTNPAFSYASIADR
jgi:hypothetical protein